ncbi:hypothetical protein JB92DRAFT_3115501 [Gautieria morchelliformis]|nr:hypothetical protein JB92DRAFT_3115501 [Gautieria morchelliformis]
MPQSPRPNILRHGSNVSSVGPLPPVLWSSHGALGRLIRRPLDFTQPTAQKSPNIPPTILAGFRFIASNALPPKPRLESGRFATQNRGPYYNAAFGPRVLANTLAPTEPLVDGLKFAGV